MSPIDWGVMHARTMSQTKERGSPFQTHSRGAPEYVRDFLCNGRHLISKGEGVEATFVAGVQVYERGTHTGALPGRVLRSSEE